MATLSASKSGGGMSVKDIRTQRDHSCRKIFENVSPFTNLK